jgi:hypothetical protein
MAVARLADEGRLTVRIIHLLVIAMLVFAAAYVYRIKMESTSRTERVLRLNAEVREQRDAIAALRAEWARLDAPLRLQGLAERHLTLKPITAIQFDQLKNLPDRPPSYFRKGDPDPIGAMLQAIEPETVTGSVPAPGDQR